MKVIIIGTDTLSDEITRFLRSRGYDTRRYVDGPPVDPDVSEIEGVWIGGNIIKKVVHTDE